MTQQVETKMQCHTAIEFWGGDARGVCLQVSSIDRADGASFVQLTMEEAALLCNDLAAFIKREAVRRQSLLKEQLAELKAAERTVFHEVSELPSDMGCAELSVSMISKFCPKARGM